MAWLRGMFVGFALLLSVSGCGSTAMPAGAIAVDDGVVRQVPDYKLGPADKVRVNVFGEEALTGEFLVGGSGKVSLPLIGEVQAAGLTIAQFQEEIAVALRQGYINEPRVSAEVLNYRP